MENYSLTASSSQTHAAETVGRPHHERRFSPLVLGSLGVVFGDIGTSPLYAFREAINAVGDTTPATVLGILSLIIWSLLLIVTLKYVVVLLRADNHGEGGTLSIMALAQRALGKKTTPLLILGIMGAALFYGDAAITPAISVISAVEGLSVIHPQFVHFTMPISVCILLALFFVQSKGTAHVSFYFGPIMLLWFITLAITGFANLLQYPKIFLAFNPVYGAQLLISNWDIALVILGAVFLSVTGAEALYADLGHFGRHPIQFSWIVLVFPALTINYLGQGALVLSNEDAIQAPFFHLVPQEFLIPYIILATLATVIASQAVITGAHSLTHTAIQLGLMPRLEIRHTSEHHQGQIFLPRANLWLLLGVLFLVIMFPSSSRLASAYGMSVACAMATVTIMSFVVIWKLWNIRPAISITLIFPILLLEFLFISANIHKIPDGAWMPIASGTILAVLMLIWVKGSSYLAYQQKQTEITIAKLPEILEENPPARVPGTAVFLTANTETAPSSLLQNLKHNKVLHEQNVILSVVTTDTPRVPDAERASLESLFDSFIIIHLRYGFMETPNVLRGLALCRKAGWKFDIMKTTFYLSRRSLRAAPEEGLPLWQDKLYITMARNADAATDFFRLPIDHVMEVGTQIKI